MYLRVQKAFAIALMFVIASAGPAHAELTPGQTKRAEALIKQFSAHEFAVRQKAVEDALKKLKEQKLR